LGNTAELAVGSLGHVQHHGYYRLGVSTTAVHWAICFRIVSFDCTHCPLTVKPYRERAIADENAITLAVCDGYSVPD
jgi:hypothetical protein